MNINDKINLLTYTEEMPTSAAYFYKKRGKFKCECGNTIITNLYSVEHNTTKSCGCLSIQHMRRIGLSNKRKLNAGVSSGNCVYHQYKNKAKYRNLVFRISKEEFFELTQQTCFYCNDMPSTRYKIKGGNGYFTYNGLDRLINSKGYTKTNVVPCCGLCNFMKAKLDNDTFFAQIRKIAKHIGADS